MDDADDSRFQPGPMTVPTKEPAINLPPWTLALIATNVVAFAIVHMLPDASEWRAIDGFGFVPARFGAFGELTPALLLTPITYQFLHGDWVHLLVNMASLAAFCRSTSCAASLRRPRISPSTHRARIPSSGLRARSRASWAAC
jgi:membrane associated rhomboid family serine protease